MRMVHESYGHFGVDKCAAQIQKHYWFPLMREKLGKFIRNCLKCIFYSAPPRNNERNLYSIEKHPEPWDTLHIDHFGPLEGVQSKRKHVLVVVDAFTKFLKLYAVNTSSKESICALQKYFLCYSRPRRIISDRGSCFTSVEFKEFCEKNICHVLNSVASPQSNGQVERVNRVLKAILSKVTEPVDHADWKNKLSDVEFALNNTIHCTTKQTPSKLLFGVEQRGAVINELTEYLQDNFSSHYEDVNKLRNQASVAIQKSQGYNEKYFEKKYVAAKKFAVGDFVVVKNVDTKVGKNKKLIPKYKGPYVVRKCIGHDRYLITDIDNCQVTQMPYESVIDSSRIKKWQDPKAAAILTNQKGNTNVDLSYVKENDTNIDLRNKQESIECTNYEFLDDYIVDEPKENNTNVDLSDEQDSIECTDYEYLEESIVGGVDAI